MCFPTTSLNVRRVFNKLISKRCVYIASCAQIPSSERRCSNIAWHQWVYIEMVILKRMPREFLSVSDRFVAYDHSA